MPITLITGLPGDGKTLYTVSKVPSLFPNRPVFYHGIKELDEAKLGWKPLDQVERWQELPHGSVLVVDECHDVFPTRGPSAPPEWIEKITQHRHLGLDFVLITQHPMNMDHFVRRLVATHLHIKRMAGTHKAAVLRGRGYVDMSDKWATKDMEKEIFVYPRESFALYKSAEVHTVKRRIPPRVYMLGALVVLVGVCGAWAVSRMMVNPLERTGAGRAAAAAAAGAAGPAAAASVPAAAASLPWGVAERIRWELRDLQFPDSAPAFDEVRSPVVVAPRVEGCMEVNRECSCWHQQGGRLAMPDETCRWHLARTFNPYRERSEPQRSAGDFAGVIGQPGFGPPGGVLSAVTGAAAGGAAPQ